MHDFIVVGAGPAGSRFARSAAERNHDVLVFEHGEIGRPLACSGHVSTDIWEYVPADARDELFQNEIRGARFHIGGPETDGEPFYKDEPVSNAIDRVGLDKTLARMADRAGADVRDQHTVTALEEHRDHVTVTVNGPDGTERHDARMVAGCDGPRSRVRRECDLPQPEEFLHGVLAFDSTPDHEAFVDVHLTVPEFFAWRIPRGEAGVEYGLAVAPDSDVSGRFSSFCDAYGVDVSHRCSGAIPIGPPRRVIGRRSFLIGDAAGQTKPFTGGGILYGMRAADHAAREIDPTRPGTLGEYERAWRDDLSTEIRLGHWVRRAYSLPSAVQSAGLDALSGEIGVHMDRPSTLFSREQLRAVLSASER
ncbi:geranylgeranyl reductase family protein [Halocatena salina]|uniref:Geranylgeranyl reductase family protein n=1 Tax=Halocatena salina TaxID=2934340 RepID=A0A8U0A436_9EURY|nr:geranylgeranyl reductase family protein [Halocatena salina]UPM43218.1 geranylgeranyl reductase family protein [Halocatena salina]